MRTMKKSLIKLFTIIGIGVGTFSIAQTKPISIGGQKDTHGCLASAGQTWSMLQEKCIQVFNEGQRLDPVKKTKSAVISAFILPNNSNTKVELFLPNQESIILNKAGSSLYSNGKYTYNIARKELKINKRIAYKATN